MIRRAIRQAVDAFIERATRRPPDFVVGGHQDPYLRRWWIIPRNRILNVYLHQFLRDDDDRALHDHPWCWASIILDGAYFEHTISAGGIKRRQERTAGSIRLSGPRRAHRIELPTWPPGGAGARRHCWTIFVTGPRVREWGFHCPDRGWVPWYDFVSPDDPGSVGRGCQEDPNTTERNHDGP